ncbi:hypothetical protein JTB14_028992 [Gonioctena quinquepunctata]|nr:hypothetical protein JTB14_028992 [Gonioctena quinquepunctata]
MDFGCNAYDSANKTTLKLLDTIHNKALRLSLGAFCTTPVESLYYASGEPSLHNRRTYLSLAYTATVSATPTNPTHSNTFCDKYRNLFTNRPRTYKHLYERIRENLLILDLSLPKTFPTKFNPPFPWTIKLPNCDTSLPHFDKLNTNSQAIKNELNRIISEYSSYTEIYADASKTNEGVGAAIVTTSGSVSYKLPSTTSICNGEGLISQISH